MKKQKPIETRTETLLVRRMEELGVDPVDTDGVVRWWNKDDLPTRVRRLLTSASKKSGGKGRGVPDFAMTSSDHPNIVVVYECKSDVRYHETEDHSSAADFAVDGALHYADFLSKEFDVIAVGVSGQTADELRVSCYKRLRGTDEAEPLLDQYGEVASLRNMDELANLIVFDPKVRLREEQNLLAASRELHEFIYAKSISTQEQKPLLVAACLIALKNEAFAQDFSKYSPDELPGHLVETVSRQLRKEQLPEQKREAMLQPFSFITVHPDLKKPMAGETESPLHHILHLLKRDVVSHIATYHDVDVLGQFYGEFLKYVAGDGKGLGIVLTPRHITELFSDLADVTPDSVVYDPCVGTGGFLISAMGSMLRQAGADTEKQKEIKTRHLIGVEKQAHMFALAASNMLLRGDGKSNLYLDSSLDADVIEQVVNSPHHPRPTVGLVNPPYSMKEPGRSELDFIEKMLDTLAPGSLGIAIVPMSVGIKPSPVRERILRKHTLTASMSMPSELFHPVGTVTLILVFTAGRPHDKNRPTWFGYWKDDGFVKTKKAGRTDKQHKWEAVRARWLEQYRERQQVAGECVLHKVTATDEWVVEAYLETDYEAALSEEVFAAELKKYAIYLISSGQGGAGEPAQPGAEMVGAGDGES